MLTLFCKNSGFDLALEASGDTQVDNHHLIEDIGIALGDAFAETLKDKRGIYRYGSFSCPMDEALSTVHVDISGRSYLVFRVALKREKIGDFECEMLKEFFYAVASRGSITLHILNEYGENEHHIVESIFKAFGRSMGIAATIDPDSDAIPSTKGTL